MRGAFFKTNDQDPAARTKDRTRRLCRMAAAGVAAHAYGQAIRALRARLLPPSEFRNSRTSVEGCIPARVADATGVFGPPWVALMPIRAAGDADALARSALRLVRHRQDGLGQESQFRDRRPDSRPGVPLAIC